MNADNDTQIRAWLDARDPGAAPARLRAAAAEVPFARRGPRFPGLEYVRVPVLGVSMTVRPLAVLLVVLALVAAIVGAGLLWSWLQFPPRGLIAYTAPLSETGSSGIRLIAANGSGARQVTASEPNLYEHSPRWSPDGRTLAFARNSELDPLGSCPGVGSIVLYDVATATQRVVATNLRPIDTVEWSPAADHIAFLWPPPGCGAPAELGVVDVATGQVAISPLGDGIWELRWEGSSASAVRVAPRFPAEPGLPGQPLPPWTVPSPNGTLVATFTSPGRDVGSQITISGRPGGEIELGPGGAPVWSADGTRVAFVEVVDLPSEYETSFRDRLAVVDVSTGQVRTLADVLDPDVLTPGGIAPLPVLTWTPDGRSVYWLDAKGGHVVEIESGRLVDLPTLVSGCDDLQWQPTPEGG